MWFHGATSFVFINENDYVVFSNKFGNYYMHYRFKRETFNLFLLNIHNKRLNDGHLGLFHDGRWGYKLENVSSVIVDLKHVCLDTKSMFLL